MTETSTSLLKVHELSKSYPDGWHLESVSFVVEEGQILCLLGPSGCGKTTLLRLIAGLESLDRGQVLVRGQDVSTLPPHRRGFGLMFQEYALFPHRDVFGNVAFGLRMLGLDRDEIRQRVSEMLELVGLAGFEQRDVNQLSGGERQRVALARSLAPQPCLLMLDEPLGALDRELRERLLTELPVILRNAGVTAITVTHDQEEAFAIADRLVVLQTGRVVQQGTPQEVYYRPASAWVARFLGMTNLVPARVVGKGEVATPLGRLLIADSQEYQHGESATLLIRPEAAQDCSDGDNRLSGVVVGYTFRGSHYQVSLRVGETTLQLEWSSADSAPTAGEQLELVLDPEGLALLGG